MNQQELIDILAQFDPFDRLSPADLVVLASRAELVEVKKGAVLCEAGAEDPWILCLHAGSVSLVAGDGRKHRLDAGTPAAHQPVARLKPRRYQAVAITPVTYVRIDETGLGNMSELPTESDYEVQELSADDAAEQLSAPAANVNQALQNDRIQLPSLPAIALKAIQTIDREDVDVPEVAKLVLTDPAIAAKLIRAANSAVFYGRGEVQTCERAVMRLGLRSTRQLVVAFALREVFNVKAPALRSRMEALWQRSTHVAAVALVLSRKLRRFNADEAQLAGLLHRIGVVPVLNYAASNPSLAEDADRLDYIAEELCPVLSERMLKAWNFPEELITVARDAGLWWRDPAPEPELADLVLIAEYVSFMHTPRFSELPPLVRLPAFRKATGDKLGPDELMAVMEEAEQEIAELRSLLST